MCAPIENIISGLIMNYLDHRRWPLCDSRLEEAPEKVNLYRYRQKNDKKFARKVVERGGIAYSTPLTGRPQKGPFQEALFVCPAVIFRF